VDNLLQTPLTNNDVRALHIGDTVHLSGRMFTARDEAHRLMLERRKDDDQIPFDPSEMALFHCGPVVKKEDGGWRVISAGPTTSARMELLEDEFLTAFGIKMVIGKGGMGDRTLVALRKLGAVYAHYPGGAGALAAQAITRVTEVYWLDKLGIPEAVWVFDIELFGPLTITMDSHGKSLYHGLEESAKENLEQIHAQIDKGA
jgi:tartrate/fumarate subfamily iron-sulfur-dependent hydro-lyase beta chain